MSRSTTSRIALPAIALLAHAGPLHGQLCESLHSLAQLRPTVQLSDRPIEATTLATSGDLALYRVTSGGFLDSGHLALANAGSNEILLLDRALKFVGRIGSSGSGPGEFTQLFFVHVTRSREVTAFDAPARRLTRFSEAGKVVGELTLRPSEIHRYYDAVPTLDGGALVMTRWRTGALPLRPGVVATRPVPILRFSADGVQTSVITVLPGPESIVSHGPGGLLRTLDRPFGIRPVWLAESNGCTVWLEGRKPVLRFRRYDDLPGELTFGGAEQSIPESEWEALVDSLRKAFGEHHPEEDPYRSIGNPGTHQLLSRLVYDGAHALWMEAYHRRAEPAVGWWRLELRTGDVSWLPAPAHAVALLAADRTGRIALLNRDALDREFVTLLRIHEP